MVLRPTIHALVRGSGMLSPLRVLVHTIEYCRKMHTFFHGQWLEWRPWRTTIAKPNFECGLQTGNTVGGGNSNIGGNKSCLQASCLFQSSGKKEFLHATDLAGKDIGQRGNGSHRADNQRR